MKKTKTSRTKKTKKTKKTTRKLESQIQAEIIEALKRRYGAITHKLEGHIVGFPDLVAFIPAGYFIQGAQAVLIEVKRPGEKPEPIQAHYIKKLRSMRFVAIVATSADEAIREIERIFY